MVHISLCQLYSDLSILNAQENFIYGFLIFETFYTGYIKIVEFWYMAKYIKEVI